MCVCVGEGHSPTHLFDDLHHLLDVGVVNLSLQPVGVTRVSERAGGPWEELGETKIPQGVGKIRNTPKGQEPGRGVIMETQGGFEGLLEAPGGPCEGRASLLTLTVLQGIGGKLLSQGFTALFAYLIFPEVLFFAQIVLASVFCLRRTL